MYTKFIFLTVLTVISISYVSGEDAKERIYRGLDAHLNQFPYEDVEAYLAEQRTWAKRIKGENGDLVNKIAGLEAKIAITQYAIKQRIVHALKSALVPVFGYELVSGELGQSKAMLLVARALLRARATMLLANKDAWNTIYELSQTYMSKVKDDKYKELSLGLSRERITVDRDLILQQDAMDDLIALEEHDEDLLLEKYDYILNKQLECQPPEPLPDANGIRPLCGLDDVRQWVKHYIDEKLVKSINEGLAGVNAKSDYDIREIEHFRFKQLKINGLLI